MGQEHGPAHSPFLERFAQRAVEKVRKSTAEGRIADNVEANFKILKPRLEDLWVSLQKSSEVPPSGYSELIEFLNRLPLPEKANRLLSVGKTFNTSRGRFKILGVYSSHGEVPENQRPVQGSGRSAIAGENSYDNPTPDGSRFLPGIYILEKV